MFELMYSFKSIIFTSGLGATNKGQKKKKKKSMCNIITTFAYLPQIW